MKKLVFGALVLGFVALGAVVAMKYMGRGEPEQPAEPEAKGKLVRKVSTGERKDPAAAVRDAMGGITGLSEGKRKGRPFTFKAADMFAGLEGADRRMAEAVFNALESNDFDSTLAAATRALSSTNAAVRLHAVEALEWFGLDSLPELTGAMGDPDEEVAEAAENAWEVALAEVNDPSRRFSIAAAALGTLSNEDHLGTIAGHLSGAALEMIDSEDDEAKAEDHRVQVVQMLVDLMEDARASAVPQIKEAYEDITGHEWVSFEEAELYVSDAENYESPEDREDYAEEKKSSARSSKSRKSGKRSSRASVSTVTSSSSAVTQGEGGDAVSGEGGEAAEGEGGETADGAEGEAVAEDGEAVADADGEAAADADGEDAGIDGESEAGEPEEGELEEEPAEEEEEGPPAPVLVQ